MSAAGDASMIQRRLENGAGRVFSRRTIGRDHSRRLRRPRRRRFLCLFFGGRGVATAPAHDDDDDAAGALCGSSENSHLNNLMNRKRRRRSTRRRRRRAQRCAPPRESCKRLMNLAFTSCVPIQSKVNVSYVLLYRSIVHRPVIRYVRTANLIAKSI